jgi:hypothetical protein
VATAKQSAQQLIEEFAKQLSTLKGKSTPSQSVFVPADVVRVRLTALSCERHRASSRGRSGGSRGQAEDAGGDLRTDPDPTRPHVRFISSFL